MQVRVDMGVQVGVLSQTRRSTGEVEEYYIIIISDYTTIQHQKYQ